jgi:HAE1 family hydrophobic/amphiphilic exporter-1
MTWRLYIPIICVLAFGVGNSSAQTATPSPSPETGAPVVAPTYQSTDRTLPDLGRIGVDSADQKTLTLHEAIELALENNRDIEISRKTEKMAEFDLKAAYGFYQPRITGQGYYERATVANLSIFSNNTTTTTGTFLGNATLTGYYRPQGTVFSSSFNNTRLTSNNPISILSPQFNSNLNFGFTQPLFRGRKFDVPRRTIEVAKRNIELTDTQFRQRTIDTVTAVQRAYWDLTYALRNLQVQRDAVHDARTQLEHNRRLVDEGQLAPIDIVAAETQVATFEQAVYDAVNTVNQAENTLKNLVSPNRADSIWTASLTPVESVDLTVPDPALPDAIDQAMQNRPELDINKTQRAINQLDQRLYQDQTKPQIDLFSSYNSAGVGGSLNPSFTSPFCVNNPNPAQCQAALVQPFLSQIGGSGTAFSDIFANKYPVWRVGLNFNLPLFGDKTAKANLGRARVEGERLEVTREQLEQNIQVEVRNALQSIRAAEARLRAAAIARENSEKLYESERRKLDSGESDIYKVLDRQTALATARSNELRARTDLNKAIADLQRATGNTLQANDVVPKLQK